MASIVKYNGKTKVSYRIAVCIDGTPRRTSYTPPKGLSEKEMDRAAEQFANEFENQIRYGLSPDSKYTVRQWIEVVIQNKIVADRKNKTISGYRHCAKMLDPQLLNKKLVNVRPCDITAAIAKLKEQKKDSPPRALLKSAEVMEEFLKARKMTKLQLYKKANVAHSTLENAFAGKKILWSSAEAIAEVLLLPADCFFEKITSEQKLSKTSVSNYRRFLSLVFEAAYREGIIPYNPVDRIERESSVQKKHYQKKADTLQLDEVQQILQAAEKEPLDKKLLIHLFLITGCRRGEIAGLRISDLNLEDASILVDSAILYTPEHGVYEEDSTKGYRPKLLKLPGETVEIIREYLLWHKTKYPDCDWLFPNRKGGPRSPDSISSYVRRFQEKYDLPKIHPHKFRHTMASILIYAGCDMVSISKRLGHANVSTTQNIYSHLIQKADVENAEHIADAILRGKKKV